MGKAARQPKLSVSPVSSSTERALKAYSYIENQRLREVVLSLIKHLHSFVKEVKPSDQEYEFAWDYMERMAAKTGPQRNEYLLLCDVLGISQLVEDLNHNQEDEPVGFALVGPFFRAHAPMLKKGDSTVSEDTPGPRVRISGKVYNYVNGKPIQGACIDIWQAALNGLYENQDDKQPSYNLRGRFATNKNGSFEIVALMPTAYPVPTDGPVGELLRVAKRPPNRPAHIHFIVTANGYETLVTQVFTRGDKDIAEDVVFTASDKMIGTFERAGNVFKLSYDFPLKPGVSIMPKAPVPL